MENETSKEKALELTLSQIRKRYGEGAIMRLGGMAGTMEVEAIPTGSLGLDIALGIGGIPRGRMTEIYGPESSGKTTLCQHIIAEAQKMGGLAAFIDVEHSLDPAYAAKCGVNIEDLYISQPDTAEQALQITDALVRSGALDLIVLDSVAGLVPQAELEGEMGDVHVGLQARLMSQALRKLTQLIGRTKTAVIFTNQIRMKIGVMFGNPETTPGGRALKHHASVRLDMRRLDTIKVGDTVVGNRTKVWVRKNKVAPPFRNVEFDILYNEGISKEGDLLDVAAELGVVEKKGSYYSFGETRLGQGRENARDFLKANPDLASEIVQKVRAAAGIPAPRPRPEERPATTVAAVAKPRASRGAGREAKAEYGEESRGGS
ncbi:MAG: recombinase RecA [Chloroflexi bacterium]|nr:recombinase RecA [Chloroflexota bacterium]